MISSRVTHCQQSGSSIGTQPRAKLFREEPEAGNLHRALDAVVSLGLAECFIDATFVMAKGGGSGIGTTSAEKA
jgi:hypothetical protein